MMPFPLHNPTLEVNEMKKLPGFNQIVNTQIPNIISLSIKNLSLRNPVGLCSESEENVSDSKTTTTKKKKKSSVFFSFDKMYNELQTLQKLELPLT